jgi:hypothetical protein
VSFSLKFCKARERTPDTRDDFRDTDNDEWTHNAAPPAKNKKDAEGWTPPLRLVRSAIAEALLSASLKHNVAGDGPEVNAVEISTAREVHKRMFVNTGDGERTSAERTAWCRNFKKARDRGLIIGETTADGLELVWLIKEK